LVDRSVDRSLGRSIAWRLVDRSVGRSIAWSIDRSIDRLVDRSIAWSIDWSIDRLVDRSVDRSLGRSIAQFSYSKILKSQTPTTNASPAPPRKFTWVGPHRYLDILGCRGTAGEGRVAARSSPPGTPASKERCRRPGGERGIRYRVPYSGSDTTRPPGPLLCRVYPILM
jgi:hypothetical protein